MSKALTPARSTALREVPGIREAIESRLPDWKRYLLEVELSPASTVSTYANNIARFIVWLESNPQVIEKRTFIEYRNALKAEYSPGTVNLALVALRRFLDWLETIGEIPYNPAIGVKGIRVKGKGKLHKRDDLTPAEARRLLGIIPTDTAEGKRDLAIVASMLFGALRQIEVNRVTIGDYLTRSGRRVLFLQGKGDSEASEYIVVNPELEGYLASWLAYHPAGDNPRAPLFPSLSRRSFGAALSTSYIRRMIKGYMREAGIRGEGKSTHSLRHSAITAIRRAGGTLDQAQLVARHLDPKTTRIYWHDADRLENPPELMIRY